MIRINTLSQVGLVVDLTKSWRYYDVEEFQAVPGFEGVLHHKVPTFASRFHSCCTQCNFTLERRLVL